MSNQGDERRKSINEWLKTYQQNYFNTRGNNTEVSEEDVCENCGCRAERVGCHSVCKCGNKTFGCSD